MQHCLEPAPDVVGVQRCPCRGWEHQLGGGGGRLPPPLVQRQGLDTPGGESQPRDASCSPADPTPTRSGVRRPDPGMRSCRVVDLTPRLEARVRSDFPEPGSAEAVIDELHRLDFDERVMTAVVLVAHGDYRVLRDALSLARSDWRDVLVAGGLANEDWPELLDAKLGPPPRA